MTATVLRPTSQKSDRANNLARLFTAAQESTLSATDQSALWLTVHEICTEQLRIRFSDLSHEEREDLAQDLTIKLCTDPKKCENPDNATAFVQSCAFNQALSRIRAKAAGGKHSAAASIDSEPDILDLKTPSIIDCLISKEERMLLNATIAMLPKKRQDFLSLTLNGDMTYAEIARTIKKPEGTIKRWRSEIVGKLTELLRERPQVTH
jgi:RNA polymerase sigma factor (sigma-70 family)